MACAASARGSCPRGRSCRVRRAAGSWLASWPEGFASESPRPQRGGEILPALGCVGGSVANLVLDLLPGTRDQFAALGGHGYGRSTTASSSSNHSGSPRLRPAAIAVAVSFHEVSSATPVRHRRGPGRRWPGRRVTVRASTERPWTSARRADRCRPPPRR